MTRQLDMSKFVMCINQTTSQSESRIYLKGLEIEIYGSFIMGKDDFVNLIYYQKLAEILYIEGAKILFHKELNDF